MRLNELASSAEIRAALPINVPSFLSVRALRLPPDYRLGATCSVMIRRDPMTTLFYTVSGY
jgi:hypothetical protein